MGRVERRLVRHYGRTPGSRIKLAAVLRALAVLARRHPKAMVDMVASGAIQAARTGVQEVNARLRTWTGAEAEPPPLPTRRRLTRREWRRFRQLLARDS